MFIIQVLLFCIGLYIGYLCYLFFMNFQKSLSRYMNQANILDTLCFWFLQSGFSGNYSSDSIIKRRNLLNKYYPVYKADPEKYIVKEFKLPIETGSSEFCNSYLVYLKKYEGKKLPLLVYCHAGGFLFGGWSINCGVVCSLADFDIAVLYTDYMLSPKYHYPIQNHNVQDGFNYVLNHYEEYNIDINNIIIMGQSQGSQMVPNVIEDHIQNHPIGTIKGAIMMYGAMPMGVHTSSFGKYRYGYGINTEQIYKCNNTIYSKSDDYYKDYLATIVNVHYDKFPHFYIHICEYDILRSLTEIYADILEDHHVPVTRYLWKDCVHGFFNVGPVGHKAYLTVRENIQSAINT